MGAWGIVLAAGSGSRMKLGHNKVLHEMGGMTILGRTLEAFRRCDAISGVVLACAAGQEKEGRTEALRHYGSSFRVVTGGATRRDSVWNAIQALPADADVVAVHDGARPFILPEVIAACVDSARTYGSGVAGIPSRDTVKTVDGDGRVTGTPDRSTIWLAQTPQTFRRDELEAAYREAIRQDIAVTDDAMVMEWAGKEVRMVASDARNMKMTTPEDLILGGGMIRRRTRVGSGYDVHQITQGRKLILGGVEIPWEGKGLLGHSDADVLVHAVMDALLGAAALGDIGKHFPDTDPAYKGADSVELLRHVGNLLREKGFDIVNVDATLIAQRPKVAPYIGQMAQNIADALNIPVKDVNVKATTTEKLGFCGRGEGMAAQAAALIEE